MKNKKYLNFKYLDSYLVRIITSSTLPPSDSIAYMT